MLALNSKTPKAGVVMYTRVAVWCERAVMNHGVTFDFAYFHFVEQQTSEVAIN